MIEIRAFRGTRRTSVYLDHSLSDRRFCRIVDAGARRGLRRLSALRPDRRQELDKQTAWELAEEAGRLRAAAELPDLDEDLAAIAEVARFCARASKGSWLMIEAA